MLVLIFTSASTNTCWQSKIPAVSLVFVLSSFICMHLRMTYIIYNNNIFSPPVFLISRGFDLHSARPEKSLCQMYHKCQHHCVHAMSHFLSFLLSIGLKNGSVMISGRDFLIEMPFVVIKQLWKCWSYFKVSITLDTCCFNLAVTVMTFLSITRKKEMIL